MTFGELVREVRVDLLLTQTQFADRLGVNRVTVGRWEAGVQMPSLAARRELRRKFRLELENKPSELSSVK